MTFRLSAVGYHTQGRKVAVLEDVPDLPKDKEPEIVLFDPVRRNPKFPLLLGATAYKIRDVRVAPGNDRQGPATKTLLLDFSAFRKPGTYELRVVGGDVKSPPVKINDFVYWDTLKPVVRSFYFQRCGQEVEDRALKLYHAACHLKDARFSGTKPDGDGLDVIGGWHDGPAYDKSTLSTALSSAMLLGMNAWNPKLARLFRLDYPLFEPGYGTADDLHHEIRAGLDWLRVMQRRDGAVYRAVTSHPSATSLPDMIIPTLAPEEDEAPRFIERAGLRETAATAAVFAMAARDFKASDLGYSVKSLLAAEKAWAFLEDQAARPGSAPAADDSDKPYRVWAAAELYLATGKPGYQSYFLQHWADTPLQPFSPRNPAMLGIADYLLYAKTPDETTVPVLKASALALAGPIADAVEADPYGVGLPRFGAHSNREIAARAAVLLTAWRLSGQERFRAAAGRSAAYLFGVNPLGLSFVTGVGESSVQHPAHAWMQAMQPAGQASGKVIPGYLVAGPNASPADDATPKGLDMMSYVDDSRAVSSNEATLLDNAVLAYLLGGLNVASNPDASQAESRKTLPSPLNYELAPDRTPKRKKK
jgi:endoglucanase